MGQRTTWAPRVVAGFAGLSLCSALAVGAGLGLTAGCAKDDDGGDGGSGGLSGTGGAVSTCAAGEYLCDGDIAQACDGNGGFTETRDCAEDDAQCVNRLGCVTCLPGQQSCADGVGQVCRDDGQGFETFVCDAEQGMECTPAGCTGACAPPELVDTYLGCDYYPTVTLNPVWSGFDFGVAVANAGTADATVVITRGATEVQRSTIAAGALEVFVLPWVAELKGGDVNACQDPPDPGVTRVVADGAYRVRTNQPVTVFQLSPLQYTKANVPECPVTRDCDRVPEALKEDTCYSYSNDAALLMPATALTGSYTTLTWPSATAASGPDVVTNAGLIAVTATADDTEVQVLGVGTFAAGAGITADGTGTVTLDQGDVLELVADHTPGTGFGADISGTRIVASRPVQVIAGHSCANVPEADTGACDHIEETMLPAETLGTDYFVTLPADLPREVVVRVAAVEGATEVSFDPAPAGVNGPVSLVPGEAPYEVRVTEDVHITADHAVLVTQYMLGQSAAGGGLGRGDPSLSVAVPSAQYRDEYLFFASQTYDIGNYVIIVAPVGASVTVDGTEVPAQEFVPVGDSEHAVARWPLETTTEVHTATSAEPFGIVVHGYGLYTSYMYPGGLDLQRITEPLPW